MRHVTTAKSMTEFSRVQFQDICTLNTPEQPKNTPKPSNTISKMQKIFLYLAFAVMAMSGIVTADSDDSDDYRTATSGISGISSNVVRVANVRTNHIGIGKAYDTYKTEFSAGSVHWSLELRPIVHRQALGSPKRSLEKENPLVIEKTTFVLNATCEPSCEIIEARLTKLVVPKQVTALGYYPTECPKTLYRPKKHRYDTTFQKQTEVLSCEGCTMDLELDFRQVYTVDFEKSPPTSSHQKVLQVN